MMIERILIIDDEEMIREGLKTTLELEGYKVLICNDGKEALRSLAIFQPDLVITDIIMPEADGIEVIITLRNMPLPPKIIAISGGGRISAGDHLKSARQLGAANTLTKPFSSAELLESIRNLQ
jgi:CheY-like chemotaxis protein